MGQTTNYNLTKPDIGDMNWGEDVNTNFDTIDTRMKANADAASAAQSTADAAVPSTRTVNSKALSSNIVLTTADVADSADKRYVTDAQKTVIENTSGTNTGDQTVPVKATGAEADTGTDDAKFLTAKAVKDSHNIPSVAPGTSGNVLTSNGTDWTSAAPSGGVSVTRGTFSKTDMTYTFTTATPSTEPTAGATYTNNTFTFTVVSYAANVLICTGTGYPTSSGTLTKASGTGDATLAYTAFTATYVVTHNLALSTSPYTVIVSFANGATNKAIGNVDNITYTTNSMTFDTTSLGSIHTGTFGYAYIAG